MDKHKLFFLLPILLFSNFLFAQQDEKSAVFNMMESEAATVDTTDKKFTVSFDHWAYSKKKHAILFYFAPMFQYGFNQDKSAYQLHHDFGLFYRWHMIQKKGIKVNFQAWAEQNSLWAGSNTVEFSKELGMISSV